MYTAFGHTVTLANTTKHKVVYLDSFDLRLIIQCSRGSIISNTNLMKQNSGFEENDHAKLLMLGAYLANILAACFMICFLRC